MHKLAKFSYLTFNIFIISHRTFACFGGGLGLLGGCGGGPWGGGGLGWGGWGNGLLGADWTMGFGGNYAASPLLGMGAYAAAPYAAGYAAGIYAPAAIISPCCPFNGMIGVRKRRRRSLNSSLIMHSTPINQKINYIFQPMINKDY